LILQTTADILKFPHGLLHLLKLSILFQDSSLLLAELISQSANLTILLIDDKSELTDFRHACFLFSDVLALILKFPQVVFHLFDVREALGRELETAVFEFRANLQLDG
jgi:hypothetical protein